MALRVFNVAFKDGTLIKLHVMSGKQFREHSKDARRLMESKASADEWTEHNLKAVSGCLVDEGPWTPERVFDEFGKREYEEMYLAILRESGLDLSTRPVGEVPAVAETPQSKSTAA